MHIKSTLLFLVFLLIGGISMAQIPSTINTSGAWSAFSGSGSITFDAGQCYQVTIQAFGGGGGGGGGNNGDGGGGAGGGYAQATIMAVGGNTYYYSIGTNGAGGTNGGNGGNGGATWFNATAGTNNNTSGLFINASGGNGGFGGNGNAGAAQTLTGTGTFGTGLAGVATHSGGIGGAGDRYDNSNGGGGGGGAGAGSGGNGGNGGDAHHGTNPCGLTPCGFGAGGGGGGGGGTIANGGTGANGGTNGTGGAGGAANGGGNGGSGGSGSTGCATLTSAGNGGNGVTIGGGGGGGGGLCGSFANSGSGGTGASGGGNIGGGGGGGGADGAASGNGGNYGGGGGGGASGNNAVNGGNGGTGYLSIIVSAVTLTTPTFTQVGPYCAGANIPPLPTTSNNGITGIWSPSIDNMNTTTYTFTPNAGMCADNNTQMTIVINGTAAATFNQIGPFCPGVNIPPLPTTSLEGITGTWSPAINNTATTTYTFTPNSGQCTSGTTQMTIEINTTGAATFNPYSAYCIGTAIPALPTVSLEGITGTWSPTINNTTTTTYTFTPNSGQCVSGTTQMTIPIVTQPAVAADTIVNSCCTDVVLNPNADPSLTYLWSPGSDTDGSLTIGAGINIQNQVYTVTASAGGGCSATASYTVNMWCINPQGTANPSSINQDDSSILSVTTAYTSNFSYVWTPVANLIANGNTAIAHPSQTTTYQVMVLDSASGCEEPVSIVLMVMGVTGAAVLVVMPSAFTPNGDGHNDIYFPVFAGTNVSVSAFRIYNRWGQIIHNNPTAGWDGKFNGEMEPVDTYSFYVEATLLDPLNGQEKTVKKEGSFTLLR